jgi:outer membrane lipoprotein-sorting protein
MKKLFLASIILLFTASVGAQSLEEITKKNYAATKMAAYENAQTITVSMKAYQQGMEMAMTMNMKKPDKVRVTISVQGMEIIQAYDGVKGYMINPMMGSSDPVEMPAADAANLKNQNNFSSQLTEYFKENRLELAGEESVGGKPAWKIKATLPSGDITNIYVDKSTFLQVKSDLTVSQMGTEMSIETYMTDYTDYEGLLIPKNISVYSNGTEMMVMVVDKVEVNKPLDDKLFTLK